MKKNLNHKLLVVTSFLLFALFNIYTAPNVKLPWLDEVAYSDVAANYHYEGLFQSSLWGWRGIPFWIGNVPLHQFLIISLSKVFGFNIYLVRGVSIVYYTIAIFLLFQMIRNSSLLKTRQAQVMAIATAFAATGCVAIYRNGRYDALGFLLVAVAVFAAIRKSHSPLASASLLLSSALIPWAGLQVIPYYGLCTLVYLFIKRKSGIKCFFLANGGMVLGITSLLLFYSWIGQLNHFLSALHDQKNNWQDIFMAVFMNPTYIVVTTLGLGAILVNRKVKIINTDTKSLKVAQSLILIGIFTPWVMHFVSKYTIYYTWMATIPAIFGFYIIFEKCIYSKIRLAAYLIVIISIIPGYPRRVFNMAFSSDLKLQNEIDDFVCQNVSSTDKVLLDMDCLYAYYSIRKRASTLDFDLIENNNFIKESTCILTDKIKLEHQYSKRFGGYWECTAILTRNEDPKYGYVVKKYKNYFSKIFGVESDRSIRLLAYRRIQKK